jgi:hypothetical protein
MANTASQNILAKQVSILGQDSNSNNHLLVGLEARIAELQCQVKALPDLQNQVKSLLELKAFQDLRFKTLKANQDDLQLTSDTHSGLITDHTEMIAGLDMAEDVKFVHQRLENIEERVHTVELNQVDAEPMGANDALTSEVAGLRDKIEGLPSAGEINVTKARQE